MIFAGMAIASLAASWWLGFRLPNGATGPRAAARACAARVHGGTKAREASVARIGVDGSRQSSTRSIGQTTRVAPMRVLSRQFNRLLTALCVAAALAAA